LEISDANAGGTILTATIYPQGSLTARTLAATEILYITDLIYISTAGGAYSIIFGTTDGAGKRIAKGNADALGGLAHHFETAVAGPVGVVPGIIAAAGQIDLVMTGFICQT
jgi:hypothetical protein